MTRKRLRPAHDPATLAEIYRVPHHHDRWLDHILRVQITTQLAAELAGGPLDSAADLSCGDAAILRALDVTRRHLGDLAHGYEYHGPIEETLDLIPQVDMLVCCETLEHLDDPDAVLKQARAKARLLVLSTPVDAWDDDNLEHYWAWSRADVEEMLAAAGWTVDRYLQLDFRPLRLKYAFGMWGCR